MNLTTLTACATCHQALTENRDGDHVTFAHPVAEDTHEAVPVDAGQMQPLFDRCHLCTGAQPIWNYRTGRIQIVAVAEAAAETYNDQWHVCHRCARFIEADDPEALTAHGAAYMRWRSDTDEYAILQVLHRGIVLSRVGRALLTSSRWPPAHITPTMLPKIRDRFSGLLRSAVDLPAAMNDRALRRGLADEFDHAPMYWINREFTELADAVSAEQPTARISDDIVPAPSGLLAWPDPVGGTRELAAVSWTPHADGWYLIGYRSIGSTLDDDLMPALRHDIGWLIPAHAEHFTHRAPIDGGHPLGPLITTWLLISQHIADSVPAKLPKTTIKAYARGKRAAPEVRIVRIRPRSSTPTAGTAGGTRTRAKPDHRFWVSGHERQQAYGPGRSLRKPVDIQPFLKGDENLPIKLSTTVRVLARRPTNAENKE